MQIFLCKHIKRMIFQVYVFFFFDISCPEIVMLTTLTTLKWSSLTFILVHVTLWKFIAIDDSNFMRFIHSLVWGGAVLVKMEIETKKNAPRNLFFNRSKKWSRYQPQTIKYYPHITINVTTVILNFWACGIISLLCVVYSTITKSLRYS